MPIPSLKRDNSTLDRDISPPPSKRKITTTTTANTVANFFKPVSEKPPEKVSFSIVDDSLLIARFAGEKPLKLSPTVKIAAFDLDSTLITTISGNRFSKGPEDWQWWNPVVPGTLKKLDAEGFAIVIISNQAAVSLKHDSKTPKSGMLSLNNFKSKTEAVLSALELPMTLFAATQHDRFRKPRTGMWDQVCKEFAISSVAGIDRENSFFVGDAAGREADKATATRKDHSCSDRNFASNVNLQFFTPEEYFLDAPCQPYVQSFDPVPFIATLDTREAVMTDPFKKTHDLEIVLFCGSPGAGKSTFFWRYLEPLGYQRVNQDILKTRDKCVKSAIELIADKQSVAVDNTNADVETRAVWVNLAKRLGVPIRLIRFTTPGKVCEHNDTVRALNLELMNPEKRTMLPKLAFTGFASRFREPTLAEGFEEIIKIDFQFRGTNEQKTIWGQHWIT